MQHDPPNQQEPTVPRSSSQPLPPTQWQQPYRPSQPLPPAPPPKPPFFARHYSLPLWLLVMLVAGVLVGGVGAGAILDQKFNQPQASVSLVIPTATSIFANTPVPTSAPSSERHWKVGDQLQNGTWQVTLNSAKIIADTVQTPGDVALAIEVTFKNISAKAEPMSSFFFEVRDTAGNKAGSHYLGDPYPDLSGTIEAGGLDHGFVGFEVSGTVHQFTLTFDNFTSRIIWDITV